MNAPYFHRQAQRGFSLVEVMVGLAIGMATVVIMMQMLSNSDALKRTAGGGNDAQMNGALALYTLERDIREAGYGISAFNIVGCNVTFKTSKDGVSVTIPLAPVTINHSTAASKIPAGDGNSDTLLIVYGNSNGSPEGDALIAASTAGAYQVTTGSAFAANDIIVAQTSTRPSPCALTTDVVNNVNASTVAVTPGVAGLAVNSVLYNLGSAPVMHVFAVRNGNLTMCDYTAYDCGSAAYTNTLNSDVWVPVASNIVSMRAQYGRDIADTTKAMTGSGVSTYDQTTPASTADTSGLKPQCSWARLLSVRVGLVARSAAYDASGPTSTVPTWTGSTVTTTTPKNPTAAAFDLSGDTNWKNYRYKALETTIPLRNAIWQGSQLDYQGGNTGC